MKTAFEAGLIHALWLGADAQQALRAQPHPGSSTPLKNQRRKRHSEQLQNGAVQPLRSRSSTLFHATPQELYLRASTGRGSSEPSAGAAGERDVPVRGVFLSNTRHFMCCLSMHCTAHIDLVATVMTHLVSARHAGTDLNIVGAQLKGEAPLL